MKMKSTDVQPPGKWVEGLSPEMPLLPALDLIFRQRWHAVLYYFPLVAERAEEDVEYVHQMRVASRRLTAALDVLAEGFPSASRSTLHRVASRVRRACGKARDLDVRGVFFESLLLHAAVEETPAIQLLRGKAARRRRKVQKTLRDQLPGLGWELQQEGHELLVSLQRAQHQERHEGTTFGQVGARILSKELHELWGRAEGGLEHPEKLHRLRIACKHVRYAAELFMPILHESFRDEFYPQLQHVQDLLGEIHDASEAAREIGDDRRRWKKKLQDGRRVSGWETAGGWKSLKVGLDAVLKAYADRASQSSAEFRELWPAFAGDSFRLPVEEMLVNLMTAETARAGKEPAQVEHDSATDEASGSR